MSLELILRLFGTLFFISTNAFFVVTEFSLTRLRQYDEEDFDDDPRLQRAWNMTEKLEIYLTGCQVGITFSSIMVGILGEPAVTELLHPLLNALGANQTVSYTISVALALFIINLAHTVWAEQTPTYLGIEKAKAVARFCSTPHYYWTKLMYPFIFVGDWITKRTLNLFGISMSRSWKEDEQDGSARQSLRDQMADLVKGEGLTDERQDEIIKALEIGNIQVSEIMVPREEIDFLSTKKTFQTNLEVIRDTMKNRYPLVENDLDTFIGILYTPEILARVSDLQAESITLDDLDHYDMEVPAGLNVSDLIDRFQSNKQELALVKKDGQAVGMVTLTDALEVIVGSVKDPTDKKE